jgi:hypothetical protein
MKSHRAFACSVIAMAILALSVGPTRAAQDTTDTTGRVTIETMSAAAGVGYTWGTGVLEYRGQRYPFTVKGFSIVDVGVAKRVARGEVYGLKNVEDFEGTFMAAVASGTLGGGAGAGAMKNQNAVDVVWTGTNQGLNFSLAHAGISLRFTEEGRALAARTRQALEADPAAAPGQRSPR